MIHLLTPQTKLGAHAVALLLLASGTTVLAAPKKVTLVEDGIAKATIVTPAEATKLEQLAADELQSHIELISGAKLPVTGEASSAKGVKIFIGAAVAKPQLERIKAEGDDPASFRLTANNKSVELVGLSEQGTLFAAYELLEQLGVRWFMPGEIGLDVPKKKTIQVAVQDNVQTPGFIGRILQNCGDGVWNRRLKLGGVRTGAHGLGPKFDRKTEPELFMQERGRVTHQEKVSHPEVLRRVIAHWRAKLKANPKLKYLSIGPHDGSGFGDDPWDADDVDPLLGRIATTDRYVKFFNLVLADIQKDYPDVGITFYAYTRELRPPVREKPNPKIFPLLAPIAFDRFHSVNNPLSWEKQYLRDVLEGWQATGVKMLYRGYLFNLADHGLPFSMIDLVKHDVPFYHEKGVIAARIECLPVWAYHGPAIYLAAKTFWNPKLDADAVIDEYFQRFYGPSAVPMREHFDLMEESFIHADFYTGNVYDVPKILTPEVRKQLAQSLAAAEKLAPSDSIYARRVHMVRVSFNYGEANFSMMDAVNHAQFAKAKKLYDHIQSNILPEATEHEPMLIHKRYHVGYLKRFWGRSIDNAAAKLAAGAEVAVVLPDQWRYYQDPFEGGEKLGLWKSSLGTNSWQPIKTISETASNQGLRYYKGTLWYRTTFKLPKQFKGRKLKLWMDGVDDDAKVWINDVPLEMLARGAAPRGRPWEFDVAKAVKVGADNVIVLSITDRSINELGTCGLNGPAVIWAEK